MRPLLLTLCMTAVLSVLTGCDALGIETATQVAERKDAEGKAIGSACRQAVRSIEDCFQNNPKAGKAAVFAGWREMDQYMRENQMVGMPWSEAEDTVEDTVEPQSEPSDKGSETNHPTPKAEPASKTRKS